MSQNRNVMVTPFGGLDEAPVQLHAAEMRIVEQPDDVLEVHDPLFEESYRIGDGSMIEDPTAEAYVRATYDYFGFQGSVRQLNNTEPWETKNGAGRWSRLQHSISTVAVAAQLDATPAQIMQMATHDAAHRIGSHNVDDMLQGRGKEDHHDDSLNSFLQRSGFLAELEYRGLARDGHFTALDVPVSWVVNLDNIPPSFINQPGSEGLLEAERIQYNNHEQAIWGYGPEVAREIMEHVRRIPDSPHGDQLAFTSLDAAVEFAKGQIRNYSEHWSDVMSDTINELLISQLRHAMAGNAPEMEDYNHYYPGDVLYGLEEDLQDTLQAISAGDRGAFVGLLGTLSRTLAEHQRAVHEEYDGSKRLYNGPVAPDWVKAEPVLLEPEASQRAYVRGRKRHGAEELVLDMQPGKVRWLNPWVKLTGQDMRRAEDMTSELREYRQQQSRWCGQSWQVVIDLCHPALGMKRADRKALQEGLALVDEAWFQPNGNSLDRGVPPLERPDMPDDILRDRLQQANQRYRQLGRLTLGSPAPRREESAA